MRPPCADGRVDFSELDASSSPRDIAVARAICATCPFLLGCLDYLETNETTGMAGGMLAAQREQWRARDGVQQPRALSIVDVSEAHELHGAVIDDLPRRDGRSRLKLTVVEVIGRLTDAGFTAEEIADRLSEFGVAKRTVTHVRFAHLDGGATRRQREMFRRRHPVFADHEAVIAWAEAQGRKYTVTPNGTPDSNTITAYYRAHPAPAAAQ